MFKNTIKNTIRLVWESIFNTFKILINIALVIITIFGLGWLVDNHAAEVLCIFAGSVVLGVIALVGWAAYSNKYNCRNCKYLNEWNRCLLTDCRVGLSNHICLKWEVRSGT